jgi:hypothetical protein
MIFACFYSCFAIEAIKTEKINRPFGSKDTYASYHNNTQDLALYGANSWAVYYDFSDWYDTMDSLYFSANGAALSIITSRDSIPGAVVQLKEDNNGQPDAIITSKTVTLRPGLNTIDFPNTVLRKKVWLILTAQSQNDSEIIYYFPASYANGDHSYFYQNSAYYNFRNYGFDAELLFSLKGSFVFPDDVYDIELKDFSFTAPVNVSSTAKPQIIVKNNCDKAVDDVYLIYEYSKVNDVTPRRDSIYIADRIAAETELTVDPELYSPIGFDEFPSQYNFNATIYCRQDAAEINSNNYKSLTLNVFTDIQDFIIVENFMQSYNIPCQNMWNYQTGILNPAKSIRVDYFPEASDPLSNLIAISYNQFYNNFSYPNTVIQGNNKISGYMSSYQENFSRIIGEQQENKTFVSIDDFSANEENLNIRVSFKLRNETTRIFTDYLAKCKINALLLQPYLNNNTYSFVATNALSNLLNGVTDSTNIGEEQSVSFVIAKDKIELFEGNLLRSTKLLVTVQNMTTKEIVAVKTFDMPDIEITSVPDNPTEPENVTVYPNPVRGNNALNIKTETDNPKEVSVYNIKGQKVDAFISTGKSFSWDLKNKDNHKVASGIYYIKIKDQKTRSEYFKKVLVIK